MSPEWTTVVLTVLAAFFGGAISTAIAEQVKHLWMARRERRHLTDQLKREISAYEENPGDLFSQTGQNRYYAEALIALPALDRVLNSDVFNERKHGDFLAKALAARQAVIKYNNLFESGRSRQAEDWSTGRKLREQAGEYGDATLFARLRDLLQAIP